MSEIIVRHLEKRDAPRVALLTWQLTKNVVRPNELVARIEKYADPKNTELHGFQYFVAEQDGQVIGSGGLCWYGIFSKDLMTWYEELVTDKKHRRKGVMKLIMRELDALAESLRTSQTKLTTSDDEENSDTKEMYKKNGFEVKPEVLMVKKYYNKR